MMPGGTGGQTHHFDMPVSKSVWVRVTSHSGTEVITFAAGKWIQLYKNSK